MQEKCNTSAEPNRKGRRQLFPAVDRRDLCALVSRKAIPFLTVLLFTALTGCTTGSLSLDYYDVPGTDVEQTLKQALRLGPSMDTEVSMTPKVRTRKTKDECRIDTVNVELEVKVVSPRFSDAGRSDAEGRAVFRGIERMIKEYARAREAIARRHAQEIKRLLKAMPPQRSCERLIRDAKAVFKKAFRAHNREQKQFTADLEEAYLQAGS